VTLFCCSGVGGTGKTETIKALLQINPDLVFMPSVVREFMKGLSLTEKDYFQLSHNWQLMIQGSIVKLEQCMRMLASKPLINLTSLKQRT
jgi:tetraacyldisaccharide-1-P 4'-kinase